MLKFGNEEIRMNCENCEDEKNIIIFGLSFLFYNFREVIFDFLVIRFSKDFFIFLLIYF